MLLFLQPSVGQLAVCPGTNHSKSASAIQVDGTDFSMNLSLPDVSNMQCTKVQSGWTVIANKSDASSLQGQTL